MRLVSSSTIYTHCMMWLPKPLFSTVPCHRVAEGICMGVLGPSQQIARKCVAENNRNLFFHISGGQTTEIKVSAGFWRRTHSVPVSQLLLAAGTLVFPARPRRSDLSLCLRAASPWVPVSFRPIRTSYVSGNLILRSVI